MTKIKYYLKETNCEHLYKDASDKRFCVDCGKRIKYTKGEKGKLKVEIRNKNK